MLFFILVLVTVNLLLLDLIVLKTFKKIQKRLFLVGNLNLTDLDDDFWKTN